MRGKLLLIALAVVGVLVAASLGYAAYLASRDSVGLPVTKLEPAPQKLAPTTSPGQTTTQHEARTTTTAVTTVEDRGGRRGTTTVRTDDHSGRGGGGSGSNSGSGSGNSGPGGGDDD